MGPGPGGGVQARSRQGGNVLGTSLLAEGVITLEAVLGVIALRRLACLNPEYVVQPALLAWLSFTSSQEAAVLPRCRGHFRAACPILTASV